MGACCGKGADVSVQDVSKQTDDATGQHDHGTMHSPGVTITRWVACMFVRLCQCLFAALSPAPTGSVG